MDQQMKKVKVEAIDTIPYLMTMISGLYSETDPTIKKRIFRNAMDACKELITIEREKLDQEFKAYELLISKQQYDR